MQKLFNGLKPDNESIETELMLNNIDTANVNINEMIKAFEKIRNNTAIRYLNYMKKQLYEFVMMKHNFCGKFDDNIPINMLIEEIDDIISKLTPKAPNKPQNKPEEETEAKGKNRVKD